MAHHHVIVVVVFYTQSKLIVSRKKEREETTYLGLVIVVGRPHRGRLVPFHGRSVCWGLDGGGGKEEGRSWYLEVVRGGGYHTCNHSLFGNNH
jgi:hypothetical protein